MLVFFFFLEGKKASECGVFEEPFFQNSARGVASRAFLIMESQPEVCENFFLYYYNVNSRVMC